MIQLAILCYFGVVLLACLALLIAAVRHDWEAIARAISPRRLTGAQSMCRLGTSHCSRSLQVPSG